jgi:hypothetical protein
LIRFRSSSKSILLWSSNVWEWLCLWGPYWSKLCQWNYLSPLPLLWQQWNRASISLELFMFFIIQSNYLLVFGMQDLRVRPCPIVFVAFSGGPKACMYKVFQVILVKF